MAIFLHLSNVASLGESIRGGGGLVLREKGIVCGQT